MKLKKLQKELNKVAETGNLVIAGIKIVPYTHFELCHIIMELDKEGKASTISSETIKVLDKLGFNIRKQGIGWVISVD